MYGCGLLKYTHLIVRDQTYIITDTCCASRTFYTSSAYQANALLMFLTKT
jgi:hypothetical protein